MGSVVRPLEHISRISQTPCASQSSVASFGSKVIKGPYPFWCRSMIPGIIECA